MQKLNHTIEQTQFSLPTIDNRNLFFETQFKLSILSIKTRHKDSFYIKAFHAEDKIMRLKRLIIFLTKHHRMYMHIWKILLFPVDVAVLGVIS